MSINLFHGDCLEVMADMPDNSVNCCVTSPPYWGLRDYGHDGQFGLEPTPDVYVAKMVAVFREVRRVLRTDGNCYINLGDSYAGSTKGSGGPSKKQKSNAGAWYKPVHFDLSAANLKPKDLVGIPWRVAFALQSDGWWLRQDIIWHKPNPMPESVKDRCTKSHEYLFHLTKSARYWYDAEAVKEKAATGTDLGLLRGRNAGGNGADKIAWHAQSIKDRQDSGVNSRNGNPSGKRNKRSVWTVATKPYGGAHFATFPPKLIEPCILAGCPCGGVVLDPFAGSGTTLMVALQHGRKPIGIELNAEYIEIARARIQHAEQQRQQELF